MHRLKLFLDLAIRHRITEAVSEYCRVCGCRASRRWTVESWESSGLGVRGVRVVFYLYRKFCQFSYYLSHSQRLTSFKGGSHVVC